MASCGFGPPSRGLAGLRETICPGEREHAVLEANGEAAIEPGRFRLATDMSAAAPAMTTGASTTADSSKWFVSTTATSHDAPAGQFNELEANVGGEPWRRLWSSLA